MLGTAELLTAAGLAWHPWVPSELLVRSSSVTLPQTPGCGDAKGGFSNDRAGGTVLPPSGYGRPTQRPTLGLGACALSPPSEGPSQGHEGVRDVRLRPLVGDLPGAEDPAEHTWVWTPSCPRGGLVGSSHANAYSPCACHGSTREPPTGQRDRHLRASPARPQGAPGLCTGGPGRVSADSATPSRAPPEGAAGSPWGPESTRHFSGAGLRSADPASPPL